MVIVYLFEHFMTRIEDSFHRSDFLKILPHHLPSTPSWTHKNRREHSRHDTTDVYFIESYEAEDDEPMQST